MAKTVRKASLAEALDTMTMRLRESYEANELLRMEARHVIQCLLDGVDPAARPQAEGWLAYFASSPAPPGAESAGG
jgi:hypothetical protein